MSIMKDFLTRTLRTLNGFRVGFERNETPTADSSTLTVDPKQLITKNFKLGELYASHTAKKNGIDNTPTEQEVIDNLIYLTETVLQPVRDHFNRAVLVTSGYRSPELNKLISSKPSTSQHLYGEAADIRVKGVSAREVAEWIKNNLDFDQLILESPDIDNAWVHVSINRRRDPRAQVLTIKSNKVVEVGLV